MDDLQYLNCNIDALPTGSPPFAGDAATADRVRGMLLGLAIGDALGNTSEGQLSEHRLAERGVIADYLKNKYADWRAVGLPSDDT
jgi:ADP-ribosylglycohydrolase